MAGHLTLVLGGVRSGKSAFAEGLASDLAGPTVYLATARVTDTEMQARIDQHQARRPDGWKTIEEPLEIANALQEALGSAIRPVAALVDSLDIWVSNLLLDHEEEPPPELETQALAKIDRLIDVCRQSSVFHLCGQLRGRVELGAAKSPGPSVSGLVGAGQPEAGRRRGSGIPGSRRNPGGDQRRAHLRQKTRWVSPRMREPHSGQTVVSPEPLGRPIGKATVRAPGVCGELVQGVQGAHHFLVTCPVDFYSRVQVELFDTGATVLAPPECSKAAAAAQAALAHLNREDLTARLTISNAIPRGKGLGSSSADVTAVIAAAGLALGRELSPETIGRLAVSVEPSDGVMFAGITLFDHREGQIKEELGIPPPMEIVAVDFGGTVDTLEFNREDRMGLWRSLQPQTDQALQLVRQGIKQGQPALVGQGASISAQASQQVLEKPRLPQVLEFVHAVGAVGVCVGHSGTIIGVLLDARERRGKSTFLKARQTFPDAEAVHHFRLLGGGVQVV